MFYPSPWVLGNGCYGGWPTWNFWQSNPWSGAQFLQWGKGRVLITGEGSSLSSRESTATLNSTQYLMKFLCSGTSEGECNCIIRSRLPKAFYLRWLHLPGMPEYQGLLQLQPSSLQGLPTRLCAGVENAVLEPSPPSGLPLAARLIGEPVGPVVPCLQTRDWKTELIWQAKAGERETVWLHKSFQAIPPNESFSKFGKF